MHVMFGTKGSRLRGTTVINRDELSRSFNATVAYSSEHGGKLIDKAGLSSAIDRYRSVAKDAELSGI